MNLGIDFATLGGGESKDSNYSYRLGFTGGGLLAIGLTRVFSAQLEFNFAAKGDRRDTDAPGTSRTLYLGYLEVPVLAHASVPISEAVEPYAYLGPVLSVLLDTHVRYDDGRFYDTVSSMEPIDIGLMLGLGAAVAMGEAGAITVDVRYNLGLRDYVQGPADGSDSLNRAIYLTVGYRADLATLGRLFGGSSR